MKIVKTIVKHRPLRVGDYLNLEANLLNIHAYFIYKLQE